MIKKFWFGVIIFIIVAIILTPAIRSRFRKETPEI